MINFKIKLSIIIFYMMLGLFFILFLNKIFYKKNINKFMYLLIIFIVLFLLILTLSIRYGRIDDSYFALCPIFSILVFKLFNILFFNIFKEELINTANFFQYEMPTINSIWTHRIYNAIVINISFTFPIYIIFIYNKIPSKQFIDAMFNLFSFFI